MASSKHKIVISIGGASGSLYAKLLLDSLVKLEHQLDSVGVILSDNAKINWEIEMGEPLKQESYPFNFYEPNNFMAPFASGSANYRTMVIIPCSMGLLGRIASGISNNLTTRAADVILKERRRLILVPRENPYNLIHTQNMNQITMAGGIIAPASPSFYNNPKSIEDLCMTVVHRVIDLMGLEQDTYRWGSQ